MNYVETRWYEEYHAAGARGQPKPPPRDERQGAPSSDEDDSSSIVWWLGQAVLAGISAGISFHVLQERQRKRSQAPNASQDDALSLRLRIHEYLDSTQRMLGRIPRCVWIAAPAYTTLLFPGNRQSGRSWIFWGTALVCGGNLYYWNVCSKPSDSSDDNNKKDGSAHDDDQRTKDHHDAGLGAPLSDKVNDLVASEVAATDTRNLSRGSTFDSAKPPSASPSQEQTKKTTHQQPLRYLELLVHNVSHSDLVLSLDAQQQTADAAITDIDSSAAESYIRPRFSCFDKYSRLVMDHIRNQDDEVIYFPRYQRSMEDPRYAIQEFPSDWDPPKSPTGFRLADPVPVAADTLQQEVRIRGTDQAQVLSAMQQNEQHPYRPQISHVYFPLLATLLPIWERQIADTQYNQRVKRVLILVTGVGSPRNWTHSNTGNSTQVCADLMEAFLTRIDPTLTVVKIHSDTNLFRYDENLIFVERELMPTINAYRDAHATGTSYPDEVKQTITSNEWTYFGDFDWRSSMNVTLSFADGSPARTHAIQSGLRPYRPMYFHFWQLKTFWHESKVVDDDIEVHSFETMESIPAVDMERVKDKRIQAVVREIQAFYSEMTLALATNRNDIRSFWLRKSQKPVIAVLLVQSPDMDEPSLYRGTNMEVSMPTGSLCAERNAIGSALAANPNLKRQDLKLIAVLAVPPVEPLLDEADGTAAMKRSHSCSSMVVEDSGRSRNASLGSEYEPYTTTTDEWILPGKESTIQQQQQQRESLNTSVVSSVAGDEEFEISTGAPLRRISLFSKTVTPAQRKTKRTVVVQGSKDINPLAPCGACNEWLKKISESNPYFKIITFTDANCNGIYVSPCQE